MIISRMGKPSSVFDKLGLGSKYREGAAFRHAEWKKKKEEKRNVTGNIQITVTVVIATLSQAEKKSGLYK